MGVRESVPTETASVVTGDSAISVHRDCGRTSITRRSPQIFTSVSDVDFGDLDGPYDPSSACPYCPFRRICGEEISWSDLM